MPKVRPSWLMWINGKPLELDGYTEVKKIAFEYQGPQHDTYVSHFHRNGPDDLEYQKERDAFKVEVCLKRGIKLICILSTYTYTDPDAMRAFIVAALGME